LKSDVTKIGTPKQPQQDTTISQLRSSSSDKEQSDKSLQKKAPKVGTKKRKDDDIDIEDIVMIQPVQPRTLPRKKMKKVEGQVTKSNGSDDTDTNALMHTNHSNSGVNNADNTEQFSVKLVPKTKVIDEMGPISADNIVHSFDLLPNINPVKKETKSSIPGETITTTKSIPGETTATTTKSATSTNSVANNGNVELLKTERRDLYDLLYGDEVEEEDDDDATSHNRHHHNHLDDSHHHHKNNSNNNNDEYHDEMKMTGTTSPTLASIFARLEDDNLDTFDPYGLADF
jgi:hypothetical protein